MTINPTTPLVGQSVTFSATVTANAPSGGSPTGTVTFDGDGGPLCMGTLSGDPATATCTTTYPGVTDDSITANYPGDGNYVLSSASSTLSVDQATTSTAVAPDDSTPVVGEQVTYTATVSVTPPDPARQPVPCPLPEPTAAPCAPTSRVSDGNGHLHARIHLDRLGLGQRRLFG